MGSEAVEAFDHFGADRIIAEGNQGGEMVKHTIQTVRPTVPITIVHASRSKQARAEPVAALYEQGRVDHAGSFPALEDEMCTWEPLSNMPSPDRLDALVWADLAIGGGPLVYSQPVEQFLWDPVQLSRMWPRVCALDFDQTYFGAAWMALNTATGGLFLYDAYLAGRTNQAVHAEEVRKRGRWIPALVELRAGDGPRRRESV